MLSQLTIKNYALIRDLRIDFKSGFSVITGETGAGKSILLGALNLILGKRADTQILLDKTKKCIIEGSFQITGYKLNRFFSKYDLDYDENSTLLRREINPHGKSRAFINDTPVNLNMLKELGSHLINIHSQHETLNLNDSLFQIAIVDSYAGITGYLEAYGIQFNELSKLKKELLQLIEQEEKFRQEQDYWQFLFNELEDENLDDIHQDELENELKILNNAESIKAELFNTAQLLNNEDGGLLNALLTIKNSLGNISSFSPELEDLLNRVEAGYIEFQDISEEMQKTGDAVTYNPERISEITDRLDQLYGLQQKHRVSRVEELIELKNDYQQKLSNISSLDTKKSQLEKEIAERTEELEQNALKISGKRKAVFSKIESHITNLLIQLGMPHASFQINHIVLSEPGLNGYDKINFLFNANKGGKLAEISKVASGGELSRLMLSIKSLISQKNLLPTIIFDEIDMGISGNIANMAGNILQNLATTMQVIAITHLPQIAGKGDSHYLVFKSSDKDISETEIKILAEADRTIEIAKMLSGQAITDASVETAKQLLNG